MYLSGAISEAMRTGSYDNRFNTIKTILWYILEENPVCSREKSGMVGRCDFVAFCVDLRLQSQIIIVLTDVQTTEQSKTVDYSRLDF